MGLFPDKKNPIHKVQKMMGTKKDSPRGGDGSAAATPRQDTKASKKESSAPALTPEQIKEKEAEEKRLAEEAAKAAEEAAKAEAEAARLAEEAAAEAARLEAEAAAEAARLAEEAAKAAEEAERARIRGCYLCFSEVAQGTLQVVWSETVVEGALAHFTTQKTVPQHKFVTNQGRCDVRHARATGPRTRSSDATRALAVQVGPHQGRRHGGVEREAHQEAAGWVRSVHQVCPRLASFADLAVAPRIASRCARCAPCPCPWPLPGGRKRAFATHGAQCLSSC